MSNDNPRRTIKSYVIRGGRLTPSQARAMERLWPEYGLERESGPLQAATVFGREAPLVLEIGFGMGQSLIEMAQRHPEQDFIGIDVHPPGIGNILRQMELEDIRNIRIYQDDANLVLRDCISTGSLDKVLIFFPDPWHKKRHHKRRLIKPDFIRDLIGKLKLGGVLHLATDWENYAEQMMEVLSGFEELENSAGAGKFSTATDRPVTKFERRGERLGHGVWDLVFMRKA